MEPFKVEELRLDNLCITVLYDNRAYFEGLTADWGFACLIEGPEKTILFDVGGKGDVLEANLDGMGIDARKVNVVVLSHTHADHTGGLAGLFSRNTDVTCYLLESFPSHLAEQADNAGADTVIVRGPSEICSGVYSTGTMGKNIKEQSLIITTDKGTVVITGCAHPGVVEIVKKAIELTGQTPLLVMGGFHLGGSSDKKVGKIIAELKELGVRYVGPCHCTGEEQIEMFRQAYEERCLDIGVGREITGVDIIIVE